MTSDEIHDKIQNFELPRGGPAPGPDAMELSRAFNRLLNIMEVMNGNILALERRDKPKIVVEVSKDQIRSMAQPAVLKKPNEQLLPLTIIATWWFVAYAVVVTCVVLALLVHCLLR